MRRSSILFDSPPIVVPKELAKIVGLDEAIVLQQVHFLCGRSEEAGRNYRDGEYWVYKSYPAWKEEFPWWGETKVKTTFRNLEKSGLLVSGVFNKKGMDRTKWYRINYDALDALRTSPSDEIRLMDKTKSTRPIPNINYKNKNGALAEKQTTVNSAESVDVDKFIEWYFVEYMNVFGEKHPSIRADQRERIRKTLADFIDDPQFDIYDNADLEEMARSFWANVESNDWRISHFATPGILKTRYYEEIWNK